MSDTTTTHCGHDARYIVQAGEGTAYCALCELEAARQELARIKTTAKDVIDDLDLEEDGDCDCFTCEFIREVRK